MILQTDSRLNSHINSEGCYFMSIINQVVKETKLQISPEKIQSLYSSAVFKKVMGEDCFIRDPDGVFAAAGLNVRFSGQFEKPNYHCASDEIEILCYFNPEGNGGKGFTHFVAGDGFGHVAYDPLGKSITVRDGYLKSKRVFKVLGRA